MTIKKGKACEFEIFIKPSCTCNIEDNIVLTTLNSENNQLNDVLISNQIYYWNNNDIGSR